MTLSPKSPGVKYLMEHNNNEANKTTAPAINVQEKWLEFIKISSLFANSNHSPELEVCREIYYNFLK